MWMFPGRRIFCSCWTMCVCSFVQPGIKEVTAVECNALQYLRDHIDCIVTALYALSCLIDSTHTHTRTEANPSLAGCFLT